MLFSSPDYPLFLLAVFSLYVLARGAGRLAPWARTAIMVLLGDLVFLLVAKDPTTLWDPLGGILYHVLTGAVYSLAYDVLHDFSPIVP